MNKRIKKIIAVTLVVCAFSAVVPANNLNLAVTRAYAAADSSYKLTDLGLETSSGSDIQLYEKSNYKNKLDNGHTLKKTYYAKVSSSKSKVRVTDIAASDGDVRIFKGSSSKAYEEDDNISISEGKNTLYVRIYDGYDDNTKKNDYKAEYKIIITRGSSSSDDDDNDDNDYDDIYLDDITLNSGDIDIDFSRKTSTYDIKVKESIDEITIKAEPEDKDYTVRVNGSKVDSKFRKTVSLDKGKNKIEITVKDDDNKRTYTLNITRGTSSSTDKDDNNSNSTTDKKTNQWVTNNGIWQYNDSLGKPLKNTWFYDRNAAKNYYLQADGSMATGWLFNNGRWYYLNPNSNGARGAMQTGWQYINGSWYYLDGSGVMQTGWFRDWSGTWYYLNSNGSMKTGWLLDGGKWYYLNSNGAMQTTSKYIDGKLYSFYSNGAMK